MTIKGQIHWCEGLFLQPHHLQYMQNCFFENFERERRSYWNFPYGVVEAKFSDDQLKNKRISFDRLHVIMPSGLEVNVPDNAYLPSLDITKAFDSSSGPLTISLGVPTWSSSQGNVIEKDAGQDYRVKRRYRVEGMENTDENTGKNPQTILVRYINARLLLDNDDRSDLEVLPLLRVEHAADEDVGSPRRDPKFIPPCLVVGGSPVLVELLRDITNKVMACRNELVVKVNRGGFSIENMRGIQFEQVLRLRTLNRFSARLSSLIHASNGVAPFEMYIEFMQLFAELTALRPDRDQFEVIEYEHDNPAIAFNELSIRIRDVLPGIKEPIYDKVPFTMDQEQKIMIATLSDKHLSKPKEYFIAIQTKRDPSELAELVLDRDKFKLMPLSLATQRVFGVKLRRELYPPLELPSPPELYYFRVMRSESVRLWERIQQEKSIAVRWPGIESSDLKVTLYMTLPHEEP